MKLKLVAGEVEQRLLYMHYEYFRPLDPKYIKQEIFRIPKRNAEERLFLRWEYWHINNPHEMSKPIYAHEFMDSLDDERMRTDREIINTNYKSYNYDEVLRPTMKIENFMQNTLLPIGGLFSLVFETGSDMEDNFFWQWFKEGNLLNGYIEIEKDSADYSNPIRIEFWDCFPTSCQQEYAWDTPMLMTIRLSPAITRNRGILQSKPWMRTDPNTLKQEYKPTVIENPELLNNPQGAQAVVANKTEEKPEPQIIEMYWVDEEGNRIDNKLEGEKTNLYIKVNDIEMGEQLTINLHNDAGEQIEMSGLVEADKTVILKKT